MRNINDPWKIIRARAGLEDVRSHDLRHTLDSRALALGESLPMTGKLLGHSKIDTTSRHAHLVRDSIKASSARVDHSIGADIFHRTQRETKPVCQSAFNVDPRSASKIGELYTKVPISS